MSDPALAGFAHGTSSPSGQALVAELMDAVATARPDLTVRLGLVDVQEPDIEQTFASLDPQERVAVVPLLLSAGYHVHVDLSRGVAKREGPTALGGALGPDPRLAVILQRRLEQVGFADGDVLVLAVAGSSDARAVADCRTAAGYLAEAMGVEVTLGFLSAAEPRLDVAILEARQRHPRSRVVVGTYLLAPGYFFDLAVAAGGDTIAPPLLAEGEAPPRELVEVILDRYNAVGW
jgi:sirohydrochlorin ferrochelatase